MVLEDIVDLDQTCSVPGRTILDNCHLLRNVIDYATQKSIELRIVNFDLEKAFDKLSHVYLDMVLTKFGFGSFFSNIIKLLYKNASSSVIVNGYISEPFSYERGVRQGCCLSPLLFVLAIEPLARKIRRDGSIRGIRTPGTLEEVKISQYADDMTAYVTDDNSILRLNILFELFGLASGSSLNKSKSKIIASGIWKKRPSNIIHGIPVVDNHSILGCAIGNPDYIKLKWRNYIQKIENILNMWRSTPLSLVQKAHIVNLLAFSKIYYLSNFLDIPSHIITQIEALIFKFVCNGKTETICRSTLKLNRKFGGIGLQDLTTKIKSFRLAHIKNLLFNTHSKWKAFTVYWVGMRLRNIQPAFGSNTIPHSEYIPVFYQNCMNIFNSFF